MLNLSQNKIRQRESNYSRFNEKVVERDSNSNTIVDPESKEEPKNDSIPRSIRNKNNVHCSYNIEEDQRIVAVMQGFDLQHEKYMTEEAADIKEISGIEITIQQ